MARNLTDEYVELDTDKFCPVCGNRYVAFDGMGDGGDGYVSYMAHCKRCGSEFSFEYWIMGTTIFKDGRFEDKED